MSAPQWTTPQWATAPSSTPQPVTIRSSFARPEETKTAPPPVNASTGMARSGFTAKPKSRPRQLAPPTKAADLPPTLSIRASTRSVSEVDSTAATASKQPESTKPAFSVVVFGFPPGNAAQVLKHFGQFGEILENSADSKPGPANVECGRNWVRIGYSEKQAALKALAQNGQVMPGQYVVGCVCAEPGQQPGLATTATNTLLLDENDVSYVQDQSMLSIDEDSSGYKPPSPPASFLASLGDESSDRVVPHEPVSSLFAQPERKPKSDALQPESAFGRAAQRVSQVLFGWDV